METMTPSLGDPTYSDTIVSTTGYKLLEVEALRWRAVALQKKIMDTEWHPTYNEGSIVGKWWGYHTSKTPGYGKVLFHVREGIGFDWIQPNSKENVLITPYEDLPLLINDITNPEALQVYKGRLESKTPTSTTTIPHRQDLVDRYFRTDTKLQRVYKILRGCNLLIERYVSHRAWETNRKNMQYHNSIIMTITLNGRDYLCMPQNKTGDVILRRPEDTIYHITEEDLLKDEQEQPMIHGIKTWVYPDGTVIHNAIRDY
jgi:hypothetical protein